MTRSSILAWRIPWTDEPGRLQSMGLQRVRATNIFFFYSPPHFLYLHWYSALSLPLGIVGDLPSPHKRKSELTWSELVS